LASLKSAIAGLADTLIADYTNPPAVRLQAEAVKNAFDDAVIYCARSQSLQQLVHGLNLNFPQETNGYYVNYNSNYVDFAADSHWRSLLDAYYPAMTDSWIGTARQTAIHTGDSDNVDLYRFCQALSPATNDIRLTLMSVGLGTTAPVNNGSLFATNGQVLSLQAVGLSNSLVVNHFIRWVADANAEVADPFADQTTVQLHGDALVTAYFTTNRHEFNVRFVAEGNGSLTGAGAEHTNFIETLVPRGAGSEEVVAEPNPGYAFVGWTGDFPSTNNPLSLTNVQMDTTVMAVFMPVAPKLVLAQTNGVVRLHWSAEPPGFAPETAAELISGPWAVVPGVTTNSVVLPITRTNSFFRLRWQWDGNSVR
jgi:hypothetical protein